MYFGSVKFFKNMILLLIVILIAVPTFLAIRNGSALGEQQETTEKLREEVTQLRLTLASSNKELATANAELERIANQDGEASPAAEEAEEAGEPIYYQTLYPDFYAPQEFHATMRVPGTVYLTFDGGPSDNTPYVLETLASHGVKATFFVTGQSDETGYQRLRDIAAQGHTLGMHSYSHDYARLYSSVEAFLDDMYLLFSQIKDITGVTPTVFRFPGGSINSYNAGIYQELLAEMLRRGFVPCDWNLAAQDADLNSPTAEEIIENVTGRMDHIERGFVLMHDGESQRTTVEALGPLIERLRDMGYQFDSLTPETKPVLFVYKD